MTRPYHQTTRAAAAAATRNRILDAVFSIGQERSSLDMTLNDVSERAGVSVQTVLRHFRSRDNMLDQALNRGGSRIAEERLAPVGDIPAAVAILYDHYTARGDSVIKLLAQEVDPRIARITDQGRSIHRKWVEEVFAPSLETLSPNRRVDLVDLLVIATDVYTWKLLVRDRGLSRRHAESQVRDLISAILQSSAAN